MRNTPFFRLAAIFSVMAAIASPVLAAASPVLAASTPVLAVTDEQVVRAIEKAKEYLINRQQPDGTWAEIKHPQATGLYGHTEVALFTLVYTGVHPNRDVITKALNAVMARPLDYTYAISMRAMALGKSRTKWLTPRGC